MARSRQTGSPATAPATERDFAAIALAYAKRAAADKQQVEHCKWVRLAAQRHLDDLKRSKQKDWPFKFDPWHANDGRAAVRSRAVGRAGAGTTKRFERGAVIDAEPGEIENYVAAGLASDKRPKADAAETAAPPAPPAS